MARCADFFGFSYGHLNDLAFWCLIMDCTTLPLSSSGLFSSPYVNFSYYDSHYAVMLYALIQTGFTNVMLFSLRLGCCYCDGYWFVLYILLDSVTPLWFEQPVKRGVCRLSLFCLLDTPDCWSFSSAPFASVALSRVFQPIDGDSQLGPSAMPWCMMIITWSEILCSSEPISCLFLISIRDYPITTMIFLHLMTKGRFYLFITFFGHHLVTVWGLLFIHDLYFVYSSLSTSLFIPTHALTHNSSQVCYRMQIPRRLHIWLHFDLSCAMITSVFCHLFIISLIAIICLKTPFPLYLSKQIFINFVLSWVSEGKTNFNLASPSKALSLHAFEL